MNSPSSKAPEAAVPEETPAAETYLTFSGGIARLPVLARLLGPIQRAWGFAGRAWGADTRTAQVVLGWGRRPGTQKALAYCARTGLPYLALEDGFLRSYGTGENYPPLAIVQDAVGIYYDSRSPSELEQMLNRDEDWCAGIEDDIDRALAAILEHGLTKYNHAPDCSPALFSVASNEAGLGSSDRRLRVLVVDQTVGDMSVTYGGASAATFEAMLAAARAENPDATIFVKTHPEVTSGRKGGYLAHVQDDERTRVLRHAINPASLLTHMDRVYVVSSTMGFEALLHGKPVTCFGIPWYAGWGVTDDRQPCARRNRAHTVRSLFAAAYWHYTTYIDPTTHTQGQLHHVTDWLVQQKQMASLLHGQDRQGRVFLFGMARWKAYNLKPMLGLHPENVILVANVDTLVAHTPTEKDTVVIWGARRPFGLEGLPCQVAHIEDGFVRSVGLGSDMIRPHSLVIDRRGMYFDPTRPSALEELLNAEVFTAEEIARAQRVRKDIVRHALTKYNLEVSTTIQWPTFDTARTTLLVVGQVEDDASIQLGCTSVRTNMGLLTQVRQAHLDAFIVYKPHPDVTSGNRVGNVHLSQARALADHIETEAGVIDCIDACDEVHTMTSLTGFDALLRGKKVVTYGQPFYAGWGLTEDRCNDGPAFARRTRKLTLDELVAGVLLRYPVYWDWQLKGYTTCEAVIGTLVRERDELAGSGQLAQLRDGVVPRLWRKLKVSFAAWTTPL